MKTMSFPESAQQELLRRLRRIEGQARGVQRMIEKQRDCTEVMNQLASIRAATYGASVFLLKRYAKECWVIPEGGEHPGTGQIGDLIELMLRLSR